VKYLVTIKRTFVEYGKIEVEAEDVAEAQEMARESVDESDVSWSEQSLEDEIVDSTEEL